MTWPATMRPTQPMSAEQASCRRSLRTVATRKSCLLKASARYALPWRLSTANAMPPPARIYTTHIPCRLSLEKRSPFTSARQMSHLPLALKNRRCLLHMQAEDVILANMMQKISNSPDYKHMPQAEALADLQCVVRYRLDGWVWIADGFTRYPMALRAPTLFCVSHPGRG